MKLILHLNQFSWGVEPDRYGPTLIAIAEAAEAAGFSAIGVADHAPLRRGRPARRGWSCPEIRRSRSWSGCPGRGARTSACRGRSPERTWSPSR
jgi:alkanesulfonate monooxygenase SsuD/methylene tetrahydromethanopterin reductase-like flavin-dependent oxidoreductase (luciferase family)